jgi:rhamnose transport system ATP-binding protein
MYRLASRVTVLRDSKYIGTWGVHEISNEDLIVAMVGREITQLFPKHEPSFGEEILRVEGLGKTGFFADVSFSVPAWLERAEQRYARRFLASLRTIRAGFF